MIFPPSFNARHNWKICDLSATAPSYTYEQYKILSDYMDLVLEDTAKGILGGKVAVKPIGSGACKYCDFSSVCHFNGEYEPIETMSRADVFARMNEILEERREAENGI